jgi:hypothetical protein
VTMAGDNNNDDDNVDENTNILRAAATAAAEDGGDDDNDDFIDDSSSSSDVEMEGTSVQHSYIRIIHHSIYIVHAFQSLSLQKKIMLCPRANSNHSLTSLILLLTLSLLHP